MTVIEELNHLVTGDWRGITVPVSSGSTNVPQIQVITGLVDFIPRVPRGFQFFVSDYDLYGDGSEVRDTAISLDPVFTARIWEGRLSTINKDDTADFKLPANIPALRASLQAQGLGADLVWDTRFRSVVFAEDDQALLPFAWVAPNDATTTVCLTDPDLERLGYQGNATNLVTAYVDRMPDKVYINDDGLLVFQAKGVDIPSGVAIAGLDIASVQGRALLQAVTQQDARNLIDAQQHDSDLDALAALASAANKLPYCTGTQQWALTSFTALARTLLAGAAGADMRNTLAVKGRTYVSVTTTTTVAAATDTDYFCTIGAGGAPKMPTANGNTSIYRFKNTDSSYHFITCQTGETVDGGTSLQVPPLGSATLISDQSTGWWVH